MSTILTAYRNEPFGITTHETALSNEEGVSSITIKYYRPDDPGYAEAAAFIDYQEKSK